MSELPQFRNATAQVREVRHRQLRALREWGLPGLSGTPQALPGEAAGVAGDGTTAVSSYFIRQNGRAVQGPFDEDRIRGWIAQGRVRPEMEFSADGQLWIPASEHRLLVEDRNPALTSIEAIPTRPLCPPPSLVSAWPPMPLPRGTEITYSGDKSTGFGLWSLTLHEDPIEVVAQDPSAVALQLDLRHVRSRGSGPFDVFLLAAVGRVEVISGCDPAMRLRIADSEITEVPSATPTTYEPYGEEILVATQTLLALPDWITPMAVTDQPGAMCVEINGNEHRRKLRLGRVRSSLRAYVEYFRIEELRSICLRYDAGELTAEEYALAKKTLCAHTVS